MNFEGLIFQKINKHHSYEKQISTSEKEFKTVAISLVRIDPYLLCLYLSSEGTNFID